MATVLMVYTKVAVELSVNPLPPATARIVVVAATVMAPL
jgi:hypothetical protein